MARDLKATLIVRSGINYNPDVESLSVSVTDFPPVDFVFANGTNAVGAIDLIHVKTYALAAAVQTLDLTALLDPAGVTQNFARVKYFGVAVLSATATHTLLLDFTVANAWKALVNAGTTTKLSVGPGYTNANGILAPGLHLSVNPSLAGYAVSGTSKLITLDPGANTFSVKVMLLGCVA